MKLLKLTLQNFKGIKEFEFEPNGKNTSIFGNNATGKSTIADAFMWLLFDKNSENKADFSIKTIDENGNEIHGLEHKVEAILVDEDGQRYQFMKIYKEKWTRKRGSPEQELTGHEIKRYVDEVPHSEREYVDFISNLIPEKIFRLVTNPLYFNTNLHWKERRETMLSISGDVSDQEVFESNPKLEHIKKLIEEKGSEKALKMLQEQKKKLNKDLEEIPIRISENSNSTPELPQNIDFVALAKQTEQTLSEIKVCEEQRKNLLSSIDEEKKIIFDKISEKQKECLDFRGQKSTIDHEIKKSIQNHEQSLNSIDSKKLMVKQNLENITMSETQLEVVTRQIESLRKEWTETYNCECLIHEGDTSCKACGQALPENLASQKISKLKSDHEKKKTEDIEMISLRGKNSNAQKQRLEEAIENYKNLNAALEKDIESMDLHDLPDRSIEINEVDEKIGKLEVEICQLKCEVNAISYNDMLDAMNSKEKTHLDEIAEIKTTLLLKENYEKNQRRIGELHAKQKSTANEFIGVEKQEKGIESFIKSKVELLEGKLNNMFKTVKFKLFKQLVNGGIEECFETLVNGVPFQDANGAGKINSGIEIINKLCEFYKFSAPVFCDNSESVVELQKSDSQIIRLVVSSGDDSLRIHINQLFIEEN